MSVQGRSDLRLAWSTSAEAAHSYLRARAPYQPFLLQYVLGYHANVGTQSGSGATKRVPQYGAVLDLGCGPGQLSILLSHHFRKVYSRDISDNMLQSLRAMVNGELDEEELRDVGLPAPSKKAEFDIQVGNEIDLSIPDNSVDMIIMGASAHWFDWSTPESSHRIWDKWTRVLRPGGSVVFTGAIIDPGNFTGPLAEATRPLRQLVLDVALRGPVSHYYSEYHKCMSVSLYSNMFMPWDEQPDEDKKRERLTTWPQENRLYTLFDFAHDLDDHGYRDGVQSDAFPTYMPPSLERFTSTQNRIGDAHEMVDKRFNTITPRRVAAWLRSASGYIKYYDEHPDDKKRIGQDDDLAARAVKEACKQGGLDYDQEIELHHRTGFLGLAKAP